MDEWICPQCCASNSVDHAFCHSCAFDPAVDTDENGEINKENINDDEDEQLAAAMAASVATVGPTPSQAAPNNSGSSGSSSSSAAAPARPPSKKSDVDRLCKLILKGKPLRLVEAALVQLAASQVDALSSSQLSALGYAIWRNDVAVLRAVLQHANPNAAANAAGEMPLELALRNTTDDALRTLLAYGADVRMIEGRYAPDKLPLSHAYWLERARAAELRSASVLARYKALRLGGVRETSWSIVGQRLAVLLVEKLLVDFRAITDTNKPLVLVLAGPPGHGKSVLAERLGSALVGADHFCKIDFSNIKSVFDLMGANDPYVGAEDGSALNNFLVSQAQSKSDCVVLLDEVEKCGSKEVLDALLLPFDTAQWVDRRVRSGSTVDIHRTIFILTSNSLDDAILSYFRAHPQKLHVTDMDELQDLQTQLSQRMRAIHPFSPPFSRRVRGIVPFVPFSRTEAAVVCDQLLRQLLLTLVRSPKPKEGIHVGNVKLHFTHEAVRVLAAAYDELEGAGALQHHINNKVRAIITNSYISERMLSAEEYERQYGRSVDDSEHDITGALASASSSSSSSNSSVGGSNSSAAGSVESGSAPVRRLRQWETLRAIDHSSATVEYLVWLDEHNSSFRVYDKPPRLLWQRPPSPDQATAIIDQQGHAQDDEDSGDEQTVAGGRNKRGDAGSSDDDDDDDDDFAVVPFAK